MSITPCWPRMIALVDMNAFFASVEQLDDPDLRGRPVGVTNGLQGTCIITCSYEARRYGIHTGMRVREARHLCRDFVQRPARPQRYAQVSKNIMHALGNITPDLEIFSVDEAFLDLSRCAHLQGTPESIGREIKHTVFSVSGIHCSVGLSGDKTTAKYAAKRQKPNGLTIIPPDRARDVLHDVPVTELCGISTGIGRFLADRGVTTCGDMAKLPIGVLGKRFGNPGRRIWHMCLGQDPEKVKTHVDSPKSMGHGKVMPPNTRDRDTILMYLLHMAEKLGYRLRRHAMEAMHFFIGLRYDGGWLADRFRTDMPVSDSRLLHRLCHYFLANYWHGEGVHQVQLTALDPRPAGQQLELFAARSTESSAAHGVVDRINERYGEFTIAPAVLLNRSSMPNVIAPAWKPYGHRQTIY